MGDIGPVTVSLAQDDKERMLDAVVTAVERSSAVQVQARTLLGIRVVLSEMWDGESFRAAAAKSGLTAATVKSWRDRYPAFNVEAKRLLTRNKRIREQVVADERRERRSAKGLILEDNDTDIPHPGSLIEFRWKYFGRPTPLHQELVCEALDDETNLYTFIFGPTGMGKDTVAGDYVAKRSAPDRTGLRVGWFMETSPFAARRMTRLEKYLIDPAAYRYEPEKTPGSQIPTASLIEDYGPFKWSSDMVWADGSEVERTGWNKFDKYYVRTRAPEQDPNLWATGLEGATYGSRLNLCVCSDLFTMENQKSPTERVNQYNWLDGTLDTRLDEDGRLVVIGTQLAIENNYEKLLENYVGDARAIRTVTRGPSTYTKYANGVAVVFVKAVWVNPETGEEESYWPERFPLDDTLENRETGERVSVDSIGDIELLGRTQAGWKRLRGLRSKRDRSPILFKAMFQQERDKNISIADFTTDTLEKAHDETRTFGMVYPHEIKVLGVDPARRYGAGWMLWAVDRQLKTITLADFWWGEKLGLNGVKDHLILRPLSLWNPIWLCYEVNRDGEILLEPPIHKAIEASGVSLYLHRTGMERSSAEFGPGALAADMRAGIIKIPYMTRHDQARSLEVESHFKAWDSSPERSKAGQAGHEPDDLAMAGWVGWLKAKEYVEVADKRGHGLNIGVPLAIQRKFERRRKEAQAAAAGRNGQSPREVLSRGNPLDMIAQMIDEA